MTRCYRWLLYFLFLFRHIGCKIDVISNWGLEMLCFLYICVLCFTHFLLLFSWCANYRWFNNGISVFAISNFCVISFTFVVLGVWTTFVIYSCSLCILWFCAYIINFSLSFLMTLLLWLLFFTSNCFMYCIVLMCVNIMH